MSEGRGTIRVKNWGEFQHYRDRTPPWIKLYNRLLDDYEFSQLPDASKAHLLAIWLLASRSDNKIPHDPEWIANKINATDPLDLSTLVSAGFITISGDASTPLANGKRPARLEGEGEGETEENLSVHWPIKPRKKNGQYEYPEAFDRAWGVYPTRDGTNPKVGAYKAFRARVAVGDDPELLVVAAKHYAESVRERGREGTPYVQQAATFYGPQEPFREFIEPPKGKKQPSQLQSYWDNQWRAGVIPERKIIDDDL